MKDSDADAKYKAMLLASEQALKPSGQSKSPCEAQKRERAALEFRKKMDDEPGWSLEVAGAG